MNNSGRVNYEAIIRDNKAARLRAFDALVFWHCQMLDSYALENDVVN